MQSGKPSKKSLKKEEERLSETAPASEAPKGRSPRSAKAPKEKVESTSGNIHRKSPPTSPVRVETNDSGPSKVMSAAAGSGTAIAGIVDSVGVMAATTVTEAPVSTLASNRKPMISGKISPEEIARVAYSYWEARGFTHGLADEDWIRAEAELLARG